MPCSKSSRESSWNSVRGAIGIRGCIPACELLGVGLELGTESSWESRMKLGPASSWASELEL
eukprot:1400711-Alexandrium_andersonii.AAC.1